MEISTSGHESDDGGRPSGRSFAHHGAGRLERAETLYREILEQDEENLNALQLLGAIAIDRHRPEEAVTWLTRATGALQSFGKPAAQHAALYHNLGNALAAVGCRCRNHCQLSARPGT